MLKPVADEAAAQAETVQPAGSATGVSSNAESICSGLHASAGCGRHCASGSRHKDTAALLRGTDQLPNGHSNNSFRLTSAPSAATTANAPLLLADASLRHVSGHAGRAASVAASPSSDHPPLSARLCPQAHCRLLPLKSFAFLLCCTMRCVILPLPRLRNCLTLGACTRRTESS